MRPDQSTKAIEAGCGPTEDERAGTNDAVEQSAGRAVFPLLTDRVSKAAAGIFEENLRRGTKPVS